MLKSEFSKLFKNKLLLLDGATGSNLMKAGMPAGVCPEQWILEHEDIMLQLQQDYVEAGTKILYAPTFTANRIKLMEYDLADQMEDMIKRLVAISKKAAYGRNTKGKQTKPKALVAGDLTMTGVQLQPVGNMGFEELVSVYKEQIRYLVDAGVDCLVVETMMSLQETRAAVIAAKETCDLPILCTLTFESDGRTLYGTDAVTAAIVLESLGVSALGANCSSGPEQMLPVLKDMLSVTNIPIIAKPNAGLPEVDAEGNTVYAMAPEEFAKSMIPMLEAGITIAGGCCGTTPAHIAALHKEMQAFQQPGIEEKVPRKSSQKRYLASERRPLIFGLNDPFMVVGERINPTGKKKLQAELLEGKLDMVARFAEEQEANGAAVLDVNVGMSGVDEKSLFLSVMEEVMNVTNLPLSIDSSHVEVLEAALRVYPGRALINSISMETEKLEKMLPIAAKYGAMFILLPLSDAGLPKDLAEKKQIIKTITQKAIGLGMSKQDIVVDGLVATVAANPGAARETLETIKYCKENQYPTICGLSNISFGLPERSFVNTAFLTMAIQNGLTMAIANPNQEMLMCAAFASDLLCQKEESDTNYITYMNAYKERHVDEVTVSKTNINTVKTDDVSKSEADLTASLSDEERKVYHAVLKGNKREVITLTAEAVQQNIQPKELLDNVLLPAINQVGDLFDKGKYFLPQLIASAETMKKSIEYLEPFMQESGEATKLPVIVIATVKGDIHDIGKNLVALMLKNYGFQVIDLGKDVSRETIINKAKEHGARIIALSALMTTTMREMKEVIQLGKENDLDVKFMIGGAVITQDYADEIGADGYSHDAAEAVKLAQRLLHIL
ncbi:MAG: homocysteine S-methyltransferase family protein [Lachnospiraceae bacterium]|nr:homocysteine S-methyltransferase family protein [Lachnospiraceae bacterium]